MIKKIFLLDTIDAYAFLDVSQGKGASQMIQASFGHRIVGEDDIGRSRRDARDHYHATFSLFKVRKCQFRDGKDTKEYTI